MWVGWLGSTGATAPRPYPSDGRPETISGTVVLARDAGERVERAHVGEAEAGVERGAERVATRDTAHHLAVLPGRARRASRTSPAGDVISSRTSAVHEKPELLEDPDEALELRVARIAQASELA